MKTDIYLPARYTNSTGGGELTAKLPISIHMLDKLYISVYALILGNRE